MKNNEYILFEIGNRKNFEDLKKVYSLFNKSSKIENIENKDFLKSIIPNYVREYFIKSEKNKSWNFENIIEFLMTDLDVEYLDVYENENGIGILNFEALGYPYGGPSSLITFIRAFDCIPTQTNEGSGIYNIVWNSEFEFKLYESKAKNSNKKSGERTNWINKIFRIFN